MREEVKDREIERQKAKIPFFIAADPKSLLNSVCAFVRKSEEGRGELEKKFILVENLTKHFDIVQCLACQLYTFCSVLDKSSLR